MTLLIGELGINHNASMLVARQLIDQAKHAGWDMVKFQKRTIDVVYTREFLDSPRESPWGMTQRAQKEALELSVDQLHELFEYARELGLEPFASAWDLQALDEVDGLGVKHHKVASPMITNLPFIEAVAQRRKHTFIGTGMSETWNVEEAVRIFRRADCPFTLMHCVSIYPCPDAMCNILTMKTMAEHFSCPVGYSGHEAGILPSMAAAMLGAVAIERHITLDRAMYGSDQAASLEHRGMELLAQYVRSIPGVLGGGYKAMLAEEKENAKKLRYWE
jgi:N-acetylneuraminate synthase